MEVQPCPNFPHRGGRVNLLEPYPELVNIAEGQISRQLRVILLDNEEGGMKHRRRRKRKRVDAMGTKKKEEQEKQEEEEEKKNKSDGGNGEEIGSKTNDNESKKKILSNDINHNDNDNLVKINIRIRENQISVVDEFIIDLDHPTLSNPLFLAQSMVRDLNLPPSMVNTIAISISEQICGLEVDENLDGMLQLDPQGMKTFVAASIAASSSGSNANINASNINDVDSKLQLPFHVVGVKKDIPSAWLHDEKEEEKMVEQHFGKKSKVVLPVNSKDSSTTTSTGNSSGSSSNNNNKKS